MGNKTFDKPRSKKVGKDKPFTRREQGGERSGMFSDFVLLDSEYGEHYMQAESDGASEDENNRKHIVLRWRSLGLWFYHMTQSLDGYSKFPDEPAPEEKAHGKTKQPKSYWKRINEKQENI